MNENQKQEFSDLMDATMPVYRMEASTATKKLWWGLLCGYELGDIAQGFAEHMRAVPPHNTITPAHVIQQIDKIRPDGRPGADEAWAMIPMDEYASAVMTQEMADALHIAQPLLDAGDKIAARMSFKEAYNRIVDANKRNGVKPSWFPSLGRDKEGREAMLAEAVRLGRLSADHAIGLIAPDKVAPMLQSAGKETLALEYKMPSAEETFVKIQGMKAILKKVES